jgi:hypothetical protein
VKTGRKSDRAGAIDLLEEAFLLIRSAPLTVPARYYIGTIPFVLGLLYFWADMSGGAEAWRRQIGSSLILTVLFIWMKLWQAWFVDGLNAARSGSTGAQSFPWRRTLPGQALVQTSGLFLLPLSALLVAPFPWVYAFYQCHTAVGRGESGFWTNVRTAGRLAADRPVANHALVLILLLFAVLVWINIGTLIVFIPSLLKSFFGVETMFSRGGAFWLNSTFLAASAGLTYLVVDPLAKSAYAVKSFYTLSSTTGDDLLAELAAIKRRGVVLAAAAALVGLTVVAPPAAAEPPPETRVKPQRLERAIDQVTARPQYDWRLPREKRPRAEKSGFLADFIDFLGHKTNQVFRTVGGWLERLIEWLLEAFQPPEKPSAAPRDWSWADADRWAYWAAFVVAAVLAAVLAVVVYRTIQKRRRKTLAVEIQTPVVDLTDESVGAEDLPADQWLALSRELWAAGSPRPALRALYLSLLAQLGEQGVITPARYKTNREYRRELIRHTAGAGQPVRWFNQTTTTFDYVWYGGRTPTRADLDRFESIGRRLIDWVKPDRPSGGVEAGR